VVCLRFGTWAYAFLMCIMSKACARTDKVKILNCDCSFWKL